MRVRAYFDEHWGDGWPELSNLRSCLIDPKRRAEFFAKGRDGGSFFVEDGDEAEQISPQAVGVKASLYMHMNPDHGVKLQYSKWDGRTQKKTSFNSKGDLGRLSEFVRSFHGTPLSLGLFIPFARGYQAVKDFIETEGELPTSIDWIASKDLPAGTFPDP